MPNPFENFQRQAWPFWYAGSLEVSQICGGVPADPNTAEKWVQTKLKDTRSAAEIKRVVDETKRELRVSLAAKAKIEAGEEGSEASGEGDLLTLEDLDDLHLEGGASESELIEAAVKKTAQDLAGLNMFKRTEQGILYIEGRQLKAALKEAVAVAANAGKITTKGWGKPDNASYKKGIKQWFPEHVFVTDDVITLHRADGTPITTPDETLQKFVHTHRGDAISYEETVYGAHIKFQVKTDVELTMKDWAMIWLTGQDQGLGASRSQGFGTYQMTGWEQTKG